MSPPSTLFLLFLLPVALTLVPQPKSYPTAFYHYPTGLPASNHLNGHLSNPTANKTHPYPHASFTAVPLDFSNRTLVDALNFGLGAGQKLAHRNCTNIAGHNHHPANLPAGMTPQASGIPHATATIHSASTPPSGASPSAAAPASQGGEAIGRRSPQVDGALTQIYPQTDDPIILQSMGMKDPAVAQAYALGMKIGVHRCSLPASAFNVSTRHPGTKGALPPGVAKLGSNFNSQVRPAEKRYVNPTAVAEMEEGMDDDTSDGFWKYFGKHEQKRDFWSDFDHWLTAHATTGHVNARMDKSAEKRAPKTTDAKMTGAVSDDALRYLGGKHEQKRGFWSDLGHAMTGHRDAGMDKSAEKRVPKTTQGTELDEAKRSFCEYRPNQDGLGAVLGNEKYCVDPPTQHKKRVGSPNIPDDKVSQGSDTDVYKKGNHPQPSASSSIHPPRSLPWVYLLLLAFFTSVSLFSSSAAADPALDPPLQTTGLVERAKVICLEYTIRTHGHVQGGQRLIGGHCYPWPPGKEKRSGTSATIDEQEYDFLAEAEEKEVGIVDTNTKLEPKRSTLYCPGGTSNTCSFSAARGFRPPRWTYFLLLTSLVLTTHVIPYAAAAPNAHPADNPTGKQPSASPPKKRNSQTTVPKPTRTLHLAALLLFTLLFSIARAAPVDEMRHSLAASTSRPQLTSLVPTPTPSPALAPRADEMRLSLLSAIAAGQTITPRAPVDEMRLSLLSALAAGQTITPRARFALLAADVSKAPPPLPPHHKRDTSPLAQKRWWGRSSALWA